jgi:hypothetical protein
LLVIVDVNSSTQIANLLNEYCPDIALHAGQLKDALSKGRLKHLCQRVLEYKDPRISSGKYFGSDDFIYHALLVTNGLLVTRDREFAARYKERSILLYNGGADPKKNPEGLIVEPYEEGDYEQVLNLVLLHFGEEIDQFKLQNEQNGKKEVPECNDLSNA